MILFAQNADSLVRTSDAKTMAPLATALVILLAALTAFGIYQWRKVRTAEFDATLKQQMLDQGMSADEIARVLAASTKGPPPPPAAPGNAQLLRETTDYKG